MFPENPTIWLMFSSGNVIPFFAYNHKQAGFEKKENKSRTWEKRTGRNKMEISFAKKTLGVAVASMFALSALAPTAMAATAKDDAKKAAADDPTAQVFKNYDKYVKYLKSEGIYPGQAEKSGETKVKKTKTRTAFENYPYYVQYLKDNGLYPGDDDDE